MKKSPLIRTQDYLFLQFGKMIVELSEVCAVYYPHLSYNEMRKTANKQGFDFPCFRLADSQKSPYFVNLADLAAALDRASSQIKADHAKLHA